MSRKPFYLSCRGNIWYTRIVDPKTGKELSAISTAQSDRDLAVMTVSRWLVEGIPQTGSKPKFVKLQLTATLNLLIIFKVGPIAQLVRASDS